MKKIGLVGGGMAFTLAHSILSQKLGAENVLVYDAPPKQEEPEPALLVPKVSEFDNYKFGSMFTGWDGKRKSGTPKQFGMNHKRKKK